MLGQRCRNISVVLTSSVYISLMIKSSSSSARVNSGPEEIPNSSSLVWFLSELFPVGRARQSAARSTSMNHLNIAAFFLLLLRLTVTLSCSADAFIQKKIECAQPRRQQKFHTSGLRGASGAEVRGQSHRVRIIHVKSSDVCSK